MLELLGLFGLLALGLATFGLLVGRRVIDDRDRQGLMSHDAGQEEVSREKLGTCCGFGLPPLEQRKRPQPPASATDGKDHSG